MAFLVIGIYVVIAIVVFYLIRAFYSLAPWIPSKTTMVAQALASIHPQPGMRFADLGLGYGRVVFYVWRKYRLAATGYEISPLPYALAKLRQLFYRGASVNIVLQDLYAAPLGTFDIIFVYGLPDTINQKIGPKLTREAKPGTYVISYNFSFDTKKPLKEFHERWRNVFVYRF